MAIKSIRKNFNGYSREVLLVRTPSGANGIGPKGQLSHPTLAKISDKRQAKSNRLSTEIGQGPKDKGLRKLDEIAENQSTGGVKRNAKRHKPKRHRRLKGDGRLPKKTHRGVFKVSAWRAE